MKKELQSRASSSDGCFMEQKQLVDRYRNIRNKVVELLRTGNMTIENLYGFMKDAVECAQGGDTTKNKKI